ncbi:hypothetical protein V8E52_004046 [Russula decolorans]
MRCMSKQAWVGLGFIALWHQSPYEHAQYIRLVACNTSPLIRGYKWGSSAKATRDNLAQRPYWTESSTDHIEITLLPSPAAQNHGHVEIQGKALLISTTAHIVPITTQIHSIASHASVRPRRALSRPSLSVIALGTRQDRDLREMLPRDGMWCHPFSD